MILNLLQYPIQHLGLFGSPPPVFFQFRQFCEDAFTIGGASSKSEARSYHSLMSVVSTNMGVSKNSGTPKSSILIGFSIINHPFWGTLISGNTHMNPKVLGKHPGLWKPPPMQCCSGSVMPKRRSWYSVPGPATPRALVATRQWRRPRSWNEAAGKSLKMVRNIKVVLLMEEIPNNQLGCMKAWKYWDIYHINWCRISSINSIWEMVFLVIYVCIKH